MSSPPPPRYSPDGKWWWDGARWIAVQAPAPAGDPQRGEAAPTPPGPEQEGASRPEQEAPPPAQAAPNGASRQASTTAIDPRTAPPGWAAPQPGTRPPQAQPRSRRGLPTTAWIALGVVAVIVIGALGGTGWWYFTHRAQVVRDGEARTLTQTAWSAGLKAYSSGSPSSLADGFDGIALAMMRAVVDDKAHRDRTADAYTGPLSINGVFRSSQGGEFLVEATAADEERAQLVVDRVGSRWKIVALDLESYADFAAPRIKVDDNGTYSPGDGGGLMVAPDQLGGVYAKYLTTGVNGSATGPFADSEYTTKEVQALKDAIANGADEKIRVVYAHRGLAPVKVFPMQSGALVVFGFDSPRTDGATNGGCLSFTQAGGRFPSSKFKKATIDYRGFAFATVPSAGKVTVEGLYQPALSVTTTPC